MKEGRPRSRCSWRLACAPTVRRCCSRSRAWAGKARRPGVRCSTISSGADCERRSWSSSTARRASKRRWRRCGPMHGCPTLHRAQASQSPRPRARAPARGNLERLPRHDLRRDARRGRDPAQGVHPQMAPQMPRRRRQPGGSRRQAVHIHAVPAKPMEIDPNLERDRAIARGVSSAGSRLRPCYPCAETAMLFWALLAPGQITMRKVDGWQTLAEKPDDQIIDLAA